MVSSLVGDVKSPPAASTESVESAPAVNRESVDTQTDAIYIADAAPVVPVIYEKEVQTNLEEPVDEQPQPSAEQIEALVKEREAQLRQQILEQEMAQWRLENEKAAEKPFTIPGTLALTLLSR